MRFSPSFKPNHKPPSIAYTSVLPHAFLYFGRPDNSFCTHSHIIQRLLGAVERQIVMNLLWLDLPFPTSTMSSWVTKEGKAWASHPLFHLVKYNYAYGQAF